MDYGQLFSRAWNICWKNKWLFLLGFLAAITLGTNSSNFDFQFSGDEFPIGADGQLSAEVARNIEQAVAVAVPLLIGLACFGVLVGIAIWLLRLTAQAGMIRAAADADAGQKISLGQAFSAGLRYLPRFVGINLLLYLPLIILGMIVAVLFAISFAASLGSFVSGIVGIEESAAVATSGTLGIVALCTCLLACLAVPIGVVIVILYPFAQRGAVVEDLGVIASISRAWQMFRGNLGDSIIVILLYLVIGMVYGGAVALILFPLGILLALPSLSGIFLEGSFEIGTMIFSAFGLLIVGLIGALLKAIWVTFRSVSFTLVYGEFAQRTPLK